MANKTFILDTNILLDFPNALFAFEDNEVILTEQVLEELNSFKKHMDDIGANARIVTRALEELRKKGNLFDGVTINHTGSLTISMNKDDIDLPSTWTLDNPDHKILQVCKFYKQQNKDVTLITNDIVLRIKSDILQIKAEGFQDLNLDQQYTGRCEIHLLDEDFQKFYEQDYIEINKAQLLRYNQFGISEIYTDPIYPNEFVLMKNSVGSTALGQVDDKVAKIKKLRYRNFHPFGITPKNTAQQFMIEALMSDIPLVIIKSNAGCGKTLLSLACGLQLVAEEQKFRRILISKSTVSLENEQIGWLPGTESEKIDPFLRSVYDNLSILVDSNEKERYENEKNLQSKIHYFFDNGLIEAQALSFLRGRSIAKQYMYIEEGQNISINQMKTIVTRVAEGTKLIISGDVEQIDKPYLNKYNNGLSWISEKMKGSPLTVQVTAFANECIRSKLAEDAIMRLK